REKPSFVGSRLALTERTAENGTSQKVGESRVTRDARAARGLGRRPGKPFLLSRIEIVRGELRGPVSAVSTKSGPSGNGNETRKHMALLLRGRRGVARLRRIVFAVPVGLHIGRNVKHADARESHLLENPVGRTDVGTLDHRATAAV